MLKRIVKTASVSIILSFLLSGCLHSEPTYVYMPDMVYSPSQKAQSRGEMRMPVKGTIPRDFVPYPYKNINGAALQSDKVRNWPDGNIYHVITMGQNVMPSYASQITPGDRWAVIHYVRALQRSQHPSASDVKEAEKE
jgi:hypothetical protein